MSALSFYLFLFSFLQLSQFISSKRNGLTIQLIHSDSPESPLYPGNLTHEERITRFLQHSRRYSKMPARGKNKSTNTYHPEQLQPLIQVQRPFYLVLVGIGTFPEVPSFKTYFLKLDTGSTLVWTQCDGCGRACFPQAEPLFPAIRSSTYRILPCDRRGRCGVEGFCSGTTCAYRHQYSDLSISAGDLARETFTFASTTQDDEKIDLIMGCGHEQKYFKFLPRGRDNAMAGILGIGKSFGFSFIMQLGNRAKNNFSYCLEPWSSGQVMNTLLRFGDDANFTEGQQVSTTHLYHERLPEYHLYLIDITIAGVRLWFPPGSFQLQSDGSGGCVIDVGAPFTSMYREHYDRLTSVVEPIFRGHKLRNYAYEGLEHCYMKPTRGGYNFNFPSMIFHFGAAEFEVRPEQLFLFLEKSFCLAIKVEDYRYTPMVIGNFMQANHRIVYDLSSMQLHFAREEC